MGRRCSRLATILILASTICPGPVWTYEIPTHKVISQQAVTASRRLNTFLKDELGLENGVGTDFLGKTATEWIMGGSGFEDEPDRRVLNHFHDPLAATWDAAGFSVAGLQVGQSSVLWQQNPNQDQATVVLPVSLEVSRVGGGDWSWQKVRTSYRKALTEELEDDRDGFFAEAFQGLGQLVHLVQDASVPAHVRNDAHLKKAFINDEDPYEHWVNTNLTDGRVLAALSSPKWPSPQIFTLAVHPRAPVPVSRLIDADRYTGANPEILTSDGIGLAEYANGNFFSKNTVFAPSDVVFGRIPYPARSSVRLEPKEFVPSLKQYRRYFKKFTDGERIDRVAVASALYDFLPPGLKDLAMGLDNNVLAEYAGKLLPKAVGYSAALIDYFFRGRLEVKLDSRGLIIKNLTPDDTMSGDFFLYYDAADGRRVLLKRWERIFLPAGQSTDRLEVPPMPQDRPPARPDTYTLVFSGQLGAERDAVAARQFTRPLPPGAWLSAMYSFSENEAPPLTGSFLIAMSAWRGIQVSDLLTYTALPGGAVARFGSLVALYRDLERFPGRRITLHAVGACQEIRTSVLSRPVTVHLVEYYEPADLDALEALTFDEPPGVKRVLASFEPSLIPGEPVAVTVDITGASFLGLRLEEYPTTYPPRPAWPDVYRNACFAYAYVVSAE